MRIGVLGTGIVGRTLAPAWAAHGHDVVLGTRDPAATATRLDGAPPAELVTLAEAARTAEVVVNATNGAATLAALDAAGHEHLAGKVLLDVANPLDFSGGFPPHLSVPSTDSLAEQVQRAVPAARVVKALNTVTADLMVAPASVADGEHTLFMCGEEDDAKGVVAGLLHEFGWRDILDLGGLSAARGTEHYLMLWVRAMQALGTPMFNIAVRR